jgi:hypothetical protein
MNEIWRSRRLLGGGEGSHRVSPINYPIDDALSDSNSNTGPQAQLAFVVVMRVGPTGSNAAIYSD